LTDCGKLSRAGRVRVGVIKQKRIKGLI